MSRIRLLCIHGARAAILVLCQIAKADGPGTPSNPAYLPAFPPPTDAGQEPPLQPFVPPGNPYGNVGAVAPQGGGPPARGEPILTAPSPFRPQPYLTNANPGGLGPGPRPTPYAQSFATVEGPREGPQTSYCDQCNDGSCDACRGLPGKGANCLDCPRFGFEAFEMFDTFRGPPEGAGPSNFGEVTGVNAAMPVYQPWGIGWQLGASYGLYDFSGRPAPATQTTGAQQQIFVTTGLFRRANNGQRASFGFVHDWMINNNYSLYAVSPGISQWRGQFEWAVSGTNSFGLWGTFRDRSYIRDVPDNHNQFRAISQINAFWHHKYAFGADTWLRVGLPLSKQLASNKLAGSAIVGATALVPLNQQLALYANAMYMAPNTTPGPLGSSRDAYNVSMGITWYPGRAARTPTVSGACWMPYMPLGNNSNFLVDTIHYD